jgi:hypothetical protein
MVTATNNMKGKVKLREGGKGNTMNKWSYKKLPP